MILRPFRKGLLVLLSLGLVTGLGAWNSTAAAGPPPGQFNQEGAVGSGGQTRLGPDSLNGTRGLMCQMGGMMGQGYCGPGRGAGGQQGTAGQSSGAALFSENCASCHPGGGNTIIPSLPLRGSSQLQDFVTFRAYIRSPSLPNGAPGPMPSFPSSRISDRQLRELYRYLISRGGN
jgi:mono/diheme cytochrome c family protein